MNLLLKWSNNWFCFYIFPKLKLSIDTQRQKIHFYSISFFINFENSSCLSETGHSSRYLFISHYKICAGSVSIDTMSMYNILSNCSQIFFSQEILTICKWSVFYCFRKSITGTCFYFYQHSKKGDILLMPYCYIL